MRALRKAQDLPRRVRKAGAGPLASMAIKTAIFSVASVKIVDFDAAEKMTTKTNLNYKLESSSLGYFSLIYY